MEWISVKDRLPEEQDFYIVSGDDVIMAYWNEEYFGLTINGVDIKVVGVTHWMPLPETPTN